MIIASKGGNIMNEDNKNNFILVDEDKPKEKNWKKSRKYEIIKDRKPVMCRNPGFPLGVPAHVG